MSNKHFDKLEERLKQLLKREHVEWKRQLIQDALKDLQKGIEVSEREIDNALNGALRNSEFPGDMVGRPDDDFDEADD